MYAIDIGKHNLRIQIQPECEHVLQMSLQPQNHSHRGAKK